MNSRSAYQFIPAASFRGCSRIHAQVLIHRWGKQEERKKKLIEPHFVGLFVAMARRWSLGPTVINVRCLAPRIAKQTDNQIKLCPKLSPKCHSAPEEQEYPHSAYSKPLVKHGAPNNDRFRTLPVPRYAWSEKVTIEDGSTKTTALDPSLAKWPAVACFMGNKNNQTCSKFHSA